MEQLIPRAWFDGRGTMVSGGRTFVLGRGTPHGKHRIQGALDTTEDERILAGYLRQMLASFAGAVVIAALVGWWAAYRGLAPVRDIAEAARRITAYPLREHLEAGNVPRELQDLVQALNAMLDRIDHAFQRLTHYSTDLATSSARPSPSSWAKRRRSWPGSAPPRTTAGPWSPAWRSWGACRGSPPGCCSWPAPRTPSRPSRGSRCPWKTWCGPSWPSSRRPPRRRAWSSPPRSGAPSLATRTCCARPWATSSPTPWKRPRRGGASRCGASPGTGAGS